MNFLSNSRVRLGGTDLVTLYLGSTKLISFVPPALSSVLTSATVTVTNLGPGGGTSTPLNVGSAVPLPTITGISPSSAPAGTTINAVLTGTNLTGATSVLFSTPEIVANIQQGGSATTLPLTITVSLNAATGASSVTIATVGGIATAPNSFIVQPSQPSVPTTRPQPISAVEQGPIRTGHMIITPDSNSSAPVPALTFGMVNIGTVQSQAGMFPDR